MLDCWWSDLYREMWKWRGECYCNIFISINESITPVALGESLNLPVPFAWTVAGGMGKGSYYGRRGRDCGPCSCYTSVDTHRKTTSGGDGNYPVTLPPHPSRSHWLILPNVSQGSFFQEHMSRPVSKMAWSWRVPSFPINPDCHWQKLVKVWSAWWLIASPG